LQPGGGAAQSGMGPVQAGPEEEWGVPDDTCVLEDPPLAADAEDDEARKDELPCWPDEPPLEDEEELAWPDEELLLDVVPLPASEPLLPGTNGLQPTTMNADNAQPRRRRMGPPGCSVTPGRVPAGQGVGN
jgi:hypothetical protein